MTVFNNVGHAVHEHNEGTVLVLWFTHIHLYSKGARIARFFGVVVLLPESRRLLCSWPTVIISLFSLYDKHLKTRGHKQKLVGHHSRVDTRQTFFSATELFQCGISYPNMLYSHLLLVCLEAIEIEWIWINSYYIITIFVLVYMFYMLLMFFGQT